MKKLTILLFASLLGFTVYAQDSEKVTSETEKQETEKQETEKQETSPKIEFKTEEIDYGTIKKGADGVRKFEFTNTGNDVLIVSRVYSTCGCTVPKKPEGPIAPGESGVIEVKYDTKRVGPIRKTISVYTNANREPLPLKIKGTIVE